MEKGKVKDLGNGKIVALGITFDDYGKDGDDYWTQVCKSCAKKYKIYGKLLSECAGEPVCAVEGCNNTAFYNLDF